MILIASRSPFSTIFAKRRTVRQSAVVEKTAAADLSGGGKLLDGTVQEQRMPIWVERPPSERTVDAMIGGRHYPETPSYCQAWQQLGTDLVIGN